MAYKTIIGTMKTAGTLDISSGDVDLPNLSVDVGDLAGSITNAKLVNDSVTVTAGNGLSGGGEVDLGASIALALDLNELSAVAIASGDFLPLIDATDNSTKKESIDDIATLFAGNGLGASSAVLAVQVSGAVHVNTDKVGISGSIAGTGLTYSGSVNHIGGLSLDLSEYSRVDIAAADHFLMLDSDGSTVQLERADKLAYFMAGDGLAQASGVLSVDVDDTGIEINSDSLRLKDNGVTLAKMAGLARGKFIYGDASGDPAALAVGSAHQFLQADGSDLAWVSMSGDATLAAGVVSIGATKVTDAMMNDDVATGLAGDGLSAASGVLALDCNELTAAAVDRANDSFVMIDATDNSTKKESIADLAAAFADGDAIVASSGKLSVNVDDSSVEINSDALRVKAVGITNAMLAGSIANAKLSNSTITVGSTSTSLGGTSTAFSGLTGLDFTAANASIAASLGANTLALGGAGSTVKVLGDLEVAGTLNTVSTTELLVEDLTVQLARGAADSSAANGAGLKIDGCDKSVTWSHSDQAFKVDADLYAAAGLSGRLHAISANTTLTQGHFLVKCSTAGGAITVTLPSSMPTGKVFVIKDDGSAASNAITIATAGSETIDGAASVQIISAYGAANLMFDGSNYLVW
tara:strand:+ start:102 stop:2015 length:1914 start_codon:yes stop_codon:yes gene_type:complete